MSETYWVNGNYREVKADKINFQEIEYYGKWKILLLYSITQTISL